MDPMGIVVGCIFLLTIIWLSTMGFITTEGKYSAFFCQGMDANLSIGEPVGKGMQSLLKQHGDIEGDSLVPVLYTVGSK